MDVMFWGLQTAKDNSLKFNTWCEDNYCFNDGIDLAGPKTTVLEKKILNIIVLVKIEVMSTKK